MYLDSLLDPGHIVLKTVDVTVHEDLNMPLVCSLDEWILYSEKLHETRLIEAELGNQIMARLGNLPYEAKKFYLWNLAKSQNGMLS